MLLVHLRAHQREAVRLAVVLEGGLASPLQLGYVSTRTLRSEHEIQITPAVPRQLATRACSPPAAVRSGSADGGFQKAESTRMAGDRRCRTRAGLLGHGRSPTCRSNDDADGVRATAVSDDQGWAMEAQRSQMPSLPSGVIKTDPSPQECTAAVGVSWSGVTSVLLFLSPDN